MRHLAPAAFGASEEAFCRDSQTLLCITEMKETHGEVGHDDFGYLEGELTSVGLRRDWDSTHEVDVFVSRPL